MCGLGSVVEGPLRKIDHELAVPVVQRSKSA